MKVNVCTSFAGDVYGSPRLKFVCCGRILSRCNRPPLFLINLQQRPVIIHTVSDPSRLTENLVYYNDILID